MEKRSDGEGAAGRVVGRCGSRWPTLPVVEQRAHSPVVEERAPASECRDPVARLRRHRSGGAEPDARPHRPSDHLCSLAKCRLIPPLIRTPVRLEWSHDLGTPRTPRHRSGHRCRGARVRPGPPCRRRRRRGSTCSARPAPGRTCTRRSRSTTRSALRRHPGPGRRTRRPAGRGVRGGRVRGRGRAAHRDRQGLPGRGPRAAAPAPAHLGPGPGRGPAGVAGPADRPRDDRTLSPAAAGFVDEQVAGFAHRIRPSGVDRLVEEAIVRFMPDRGPAPPGGRRRRPARPRAHPSGVLRGHRWVEAAGRPRRRPGPRHRPLGRCGPAGRPRLHRLPGRAPLRGARGDGPAPARPGPRHHRDRRDRHPATPATAGSGPAGGAARAPLRRGDHHPGRPAAPGAGGEHPLASSTPTRSAPGAAPPAPR